MATLNLIDIGTVPDDNTGDPHRDSFNKSNTNDQALNTDIGTINSTLTTKRDGVTVNRTADSADFTVVIPANSYIERIVMFHSAGVPEIEIGTTGDGTDDIMYQDTISSGDSLPVTVNKYTSAGLTLYFSVTPASGTFDTNIDYIQNYK